MIQRRTAAGAFLLLLPLAVIAADAKKPEKKDAPRVALTIPLGVAPGVATRVTVRGSKLDAVTGVRFTSAKVKARILGKGKAPLGPAQSAARFGDTQVELEVTVPAGETASFVAIGPGGESKPHELLVEAGLPVVAEKEPNDGFRQAQAVPLPGVVDGTVRQPQDVDVYRFEGKAGRHVVCEVQAARYGSALDSILTLYDAGGRELIASDDCNGSADSRLEITLPRDGTYYLGLIDAHDQGGPVHVYRLVTRVK